jgi:hypothetical protein
MVGRLIIEIGYPTLLLKTNGFTYKTELAITANPDQRNIQFLIFMFFFQETISLAPVLNMHRALLEMPDGG